MQISARVTNKAGEHHATVRTEANEQTLHIPAKPNGSGSAVNGGELLFLALATCYCNDVYREAKERDIKITSVHVEVTGHFSTKGVPAEDIQYRAWVESPNPEQDVLELLRHTDSVAEIQNTLRRGTAVVLTECKVEHGARATSIQAD